MVHVALSSCQEVFMAQYGPPQTVPQLEQTAKELRRDVIRMLCEAQSGHPGGSLSAADIVAALYFRVLHHDPENPTWAERDRFIMSKGHAVPIVYAAMAVTGYFPKEELMTLRKLNSRLQGHPSVKDLPGIEASTGSLGQGLSIGLGMALGLRMDAVDSRVFVMMGDGEIEEGQIWEAAMAAAHFKADNLIAILDRNRYQLDGSTDEIMDISPVVEKWKAFGWRVLDIDGHSMYQVVHGLEAAREKTGRPTIIVAKTVKGKGVPFMENDNEYHGKAPSSEEMERALVYLA
jgi:transketolase